MILLGSTGSIGVTTLKVAEEFHLPVEVLVAGRNIELLRQQVAAFSPEIVVVADERDREAIDAPLVLSGEEGILEALQRSRSSIVVNALVGFLGLRPTLKAIELGKSVALANKESLVAGGKFIDISKIIPIDSEHFALSYILEGRRERARKLTITASGGALREWSREEMERATFAQALNHPNWSMGYKITIDSATMTNKLFELLEAYWLYGTRELEALIEPRSLIHAIVEFSDGSLLLHGSRADMRLPIAYALAGERGERIVEPIDLTEIGSLQFREIDPERYPIWQIKDELLQRPELGVVINAANEVAVEKFRRGEIPFFTMAELVIESFHRFQRVEIDSIDQIFRIDREVRNYVETL
ncbi:MAG: 1-deoxy-D-xylulose-5-phosphate reductoisomerase [Epsilonproteobacteria bacterium]|nr:1-deoxy-D-xylulose-5-phosphate reductoisomerase [Campylobacterota bacterium]NPA57113.1 1-deoxy-D-xylulose-5-phosphate reductoisomerase [Campylobacterota bacterium]